MICDKMMIVWWWWIMIYDYDEWMRMNDVMMNDYDDDKWMWMNK